MAVTAYLYGSFPAKALNKEIDYDTDTIKCALCDSGYTPDQDTHDYFNDITNELTGGVGGYTSGGVTLGTKTVGYTAGTNVTKFSCADISINPATFTARYAIIYDAQTGVAATSPLIGYIDFGADVSPSAAEFKITINASGLFTITVG